MNSHVFDACLASMAERYKVAAQDDDADPLFSPGPEALGAALGFQGDDWRGLVQRFREGQRDKTAFLASVGKAVIGAGVKRGLTRGVTSKVTQGLRGAGLSREGVQKAVGGATLGAGALGVGAAGYAAG